MDDNREKVQNDETMCNVKVNDYNYTVYIKNLNEKIRKDELKKTLYAFCSQYGPILEISAERTLKRRGQAFVVFKDHMSAKHAVEELNGLSLFDKPISVDFACKKSDLIAKIDGTFDSNIVAMRKLKRRQANEKKRMAEMSNDEEYHAKKIFSKINVDVNLPNKILFVQKLEESATESSLTNLFSKIPGFEKVALPPGRPVAFVFYENKVYATQAMREFQGYKINQNDKSGLLISYAKW